MSRLSGQSTHFDCISSRTSPKDQNQSYTMTEEGTDLSTDVLLIDGDQNVSLQHRSFPIFRTGPGNEATTRAHPK